MYMLVIFLIPVWIVWCVFRWFWMVCWRLFFLVVFWGVMCVLIYEMLRVFFWSLKVWKTNRKYWLMDVGLNEVHAKPIGEHPTGSFRSVWIVYGVLVLLACRLRKHLRCILDFCNLNPYKSLRVKVTLVVCCLRLTLPAFLVLRGFLAVYALGR